MASSRTPYFLDFPIGFQKEVVDRITAIARSGKNIQLVGTQGSGRSLTFRVLSKSKKVLEDFNIYNLDLSLIEDRTFSAVAKLLISKLAEWEVPLGKTDKKTIILVDSFENVISFLDTSLVRVFKGVSDQYRDYLSFVFSIDKPVEDGNPYWGEVCYLPPLGKIDFDWFWKGLGGSGGHKNKIYKASGGHMAVAKRLWEAVLAHYELDKILENPRINPHLLYQLELIKEGLDGCENYFDIPVYNTFIAGGADKKDLTALEHKALVFLEKNVGLIVAREDLITNIWGENASQEVADHALDQLMHRLRVKVEKSGFKIETVRGRGYRLTNK